MKKCFCMRCHIEVPQETEKCECGGTTFVYGEGFHLKKSGVTCECGSNTFETMMHMDLTHKAVTNYRCSKCGNLIGTEYFRGKGAEMFW